MGGNMNATTTQLVHLVLVLAGLAAVVILTLHGDIQGTTAAVIISASVGITATTAGTAVATQLLNQPPPAQTPPAATTEPRIP